MCSRYNSEVFEPKLTGPSFSPVPRDQLPWVQGPMTMTLAAPGLVCSMVWYVCRALQILGVVPAADGQHGRLDGLEVLPDGPRLPEVVVVGVVELMFQNGLAPFRYFVFELASGPMRR